MRSPVTFSSSSSDISTFKRIDCDPDSNAGDQMARFAVHVDGSSGSATLQVALVKNNTVVAFEDATCTAAATRRTADDNSSGDYITTVEFTHSGTDKVDLLGMRRGDAPASKFNTSPEAQNDGYEWWYGITDLSTVTEATVYHAVSPKI